MPKIQTSIARLSREMEMMLSCSLEAKKWVCGWRRSVWALAFRHFKKGMMLCNADFLSKLFEEGRLILWRIRESVDLEWWDEVYSQFIFLPGRPFRNVWDILAVLFLVWPSKEKRKQRKRKQDFSLSFPSCNLPGLGTIWSSFHCVSSKSPTLCSWISSDGSHRPHKKLAMGQNVKTWGAFLGMITPCGGSLFESFLGVHHGRIPNWNPRGKGDFESGQAELWCRSFGTWTSSQLSWPDTMRMEIWF